MAAIGAAALAGVLLAVGLWAMTSPGPTSVTQPDRRAAQRAEALSRAATPVGNQGATPSTAANAATEAATNPQPAVGDCVGFEGPTGARRVVLVDCRAQHTFEVAALVDGGALFATAPSEVEWKALLELRCPDAMRAYLGDRYDPFGQLSLKVSAPTAGEWAAGDHQGECLLSVAGTDGKPLLVTGAARDLEPTPQAAIGDCLALGGDGQLATRVDCTAAHQLQVTAPFILEGRFEHYPTAEQWSGLDRECRAPAAQRFGQQMVATSGRTLTAVAVRIPIQSWVVGRRHSACAVGELDTSGQLTVRTTSLER